MGCKTVLGLILLGALTAVLGGELKITSTTCANNPSSSFPPWSGWSGPASDVAITGSGATDVTWATIELECTQAARQVGVNIPTGVFLPICP